MIRREEIREVITLLETNRYQGYEALDLAVDEALGMLRRLCELRGKRK